ncbi:TetR/AcrR family transcriptional regulator [Collinsella stercoris]|uniref:Transcriptional regulator, TetR family n=1 Tax=Collinsella stercoris DSM 13279 TaxID=445975 RepID=B6GA42_9ACTN|nr:TetR/AcrR family transcriptional regulator [Collinsella stercoris]EEA90897.1 transcriptional regulator, TetR family [Collinsella stercoris DSM 13279]UEA45340.1 TetR/AcrR family transcriptional regulator [Collinsella stercoris DSM 13279]UWP12135.1 TetR/AcrR family transcriptional regulator [Collinsella stercoris]
MASDISGHHERLAHDDRRDEIIDAVRAVVAESGISRLSISAVTKRVGCTRSLFYHYFPTKEDALQAALDQSIDAFMAQLTAWNDQRVTGDIEGALNSAAHMLKTLVLQQDDAMPHTVATGGNAGLYATFVHRVADRTARYICQSTVVDFAALHEVRIDHLYETFYVLITGLVMFVRANPDVPEETVKDIIASTLHIEGYTAKYPERRPTR